jgi:hypothetical protein
MYTEGIHAIWERCSFKMEKLVYSTSIFSKTVVFSHKFQEGCKNIIKRVSRLWLWRGRMSSTYIEGFHASGENYSFKMIKSLNPQD